MTGDSVRPDIPRRRAKWPRGIGAATTTPTTGSTTRSFDDAVDDDVADDGRRDEPVARGGTATRGAGEGGRPSERVDSERVGFFGRIARFFREVVAELRKVIWPTRKELLTYTAVVIVFVDGHADDRRRCWTSPSPGRAVGLRQR